jgi:hypothetical protein
MKKTISTTPTRKIVVQPNTPESDPFADPSSLQTQPSSYPLTPKQRQAILNGKNPFKKFNLDCLSCFPKRSGRYRVENPKYNLAYMVSRWKSLPSGAGVHPLQDLNQQSSLSTQEKIRILDELFKDADWEPLTLNENVQKSISNLLCTFLVENPNIKLSQDHILLKFIEHRKLAPQQLTALQLGLDLPVTFKEMTPLLERFSNRKAPIYSPENKIVMRWLGVPTVTQGRDVSLECQKLSEFVRKLIEDAENWLSIKRENIQQHADYFRCTTDKIAEALDKMESAFLFAGYVKRQTERGFTQLRLPSDTRIDLPKRDNRDDKSGTFSKVLSASYTDGSDPRPIFVKKHVVYSRKQFQKALKSKAGLDHTVFSRLPHDLNEIFAFTVLNVTKAGKVPKVIGPAFVAYVGRRPGQSDAVFRTLLPQENLREFFAARGTTGESRKQLVNLFKEGVAAIKDFGIPHLDMKCENLLRRVGLTQEIVVADLGSIGLDVPTDQKLGTFPFVYRMINSTNDYKNPFTLTQEQALDEDLFGLAISTLYNLTGTHYLSEIKTRIKTAYPNERTDWFSKNEENRVEILLAFLVGLKDPKYSEIKPILTVLEDIQNRLTAFKSESSA